MSGIRFTIIVFHLCASLGGSLRSYVEGLRDKFELSFHQQCGQFPFVDHFTRLIQRPSGKFIRFAFTDPWFRIGGMGDRLAGLTTAVTLSVRFNRTLLLRSDEELFHYFRPYQGQKYDPRYANHTWAEWEAWSGFNKDWIGRKRVEFDLTNCINDLGSKGDQCSMDGGDMTNFPSILLRSNRCYLCRYNERDSPAKHDLAQILHITSNTNLFTAAGCMLRLALWPTEYLWTQLDHFYEDMGVRSDQGFQQQIGVHFRCGDITFNHLSNKQDTLLEPHPADAVCTTVSPTSEKESSNTVSYYMKTGNPLQLATCVAHVLQSSHVHSESRIHHPSHGNHSRGQHSPLNRRHSMANVTLGRHHHHQQHHASLVYVASDNAAAANQIAHHVLSSTSSSALPTRNTQVCTASPITGALQNSSSNDRTSSSFKNGSRSDSKSAHVSCHIDTDRTATCLAQTIEVWMALALSDRFIVQSERPVQSASPGYSMPVSAFSRYAAIYGLRSDVAIVHHNDSNNSNLTWQMMQSQCDVGDQYVTTQHQADEEVQRRASRTTYGNWFC